MKAFACLLLALLVSSTMFGVCNGAVWFEGVDPQENQNIRLMNMEHKLPIVKPYTGLPLCDLILEETEPDSINLTIIVSTWALAYQNENFETWFSINSQEPEKLAGVLDITPSAAGNFYERRYNVTLSGLVDGTHLIKIRVAGEYYGPESGNYDCEGNVSIIIEHTDRNLTESPTIESFPTSTIISAVAVLIGVSVAITVLMIAHRRKMSV